MMIHRPFLSSILWAALLATSCATLKQRMREASSCDQAIGDHRDISGDPGYRDVSPLIREEYEIEVARCFLYERRPEEALKLAGTWTENPVERLKVTARANARIGRAKEARAALETLAAQPSPSHDFFLEYPEIRAYSSEDWFVLAALRAASKNPSVDVQSYVARLSQQTNRRFLPLRVAAADPDRPPGDWAVWVGIVRDARIDRARGEIVLHVEGIDIETETEKRERVEAVHGKEKLPGWRTEWVSTPEYSTETTHKEKLAPNNRHFVVKYQATAEDVVGMRIVTAIGRYRGRDESGAPVLEALMVHERKPKERSEVQGARAQPR